MMRRGQYSLEFLLTYSWAFLVVAIALAAIYSFGWINVDQILPEKCEFYGQIHCDDFQAYADTDENVIELILINRFGADLHVTDVKVADSTTDDNCNIEDWKATWEESGNYEVWGSSEVLEVQLAGCDQSTKWLPGNRYEAQVAVTFYNPVTGNNHHTQLGSILIYVRDDS